MAYYGYGGYNDYSGVDEGAGVYGGYYEQYYEGGHDYGPEYEDINQGIGQQAVSNEASSIVHQLLQDNDVVLFALTYCGPCKNTKALLDKKRVPYLLYNLDTDPYITKAQYFDALEPLSGIRSVPQLFIHGKFYGGSKEARVGLERGEVQQMCGQSGGYNARAIVRKLLQENDVVLFAFTYCGPCKRTKELLDEQGITYLVYNLDTDPNITQSKYMDALEPLSGIRTVPQLFIRGKFYGDSQQIRSGVAGGEVQQMCGQHGGQHNDAHSFVHQLLQENEVIMFATTICNYSRKAKAMLEENEIPYFVHYIDTDPYIEKKQYQDALELLSGIRTLPQLFIRGRFYGDSQQTKRGIATGEIQQLCT